MGKKMDNQVMPITRVKGMAYYIGADGFVYEAVKGNAGRPKKIKTTGTEQVAVAEKIDIDKTTGV